LVRVELQRGVVPKVSPENPMVIGGDDLVDHRGALRSAK
jgi:hypothetical protein